MFDFLKFHGAPGAPLQPRGDNLRYIAATTDRLGPATVPAVWPTGVSQLAQAIDACQRCDAGDVCSDWLRCTPKRIETRRTSAQTRPNTRR